MGKKWLWGAMSLMIWLGILQTAPARASWDITFGGCEDDGVRAVVSTDDGGYLIVGWTESQEGGSADGWAFKLNEHGHLEWEQVFGGEEGDIINTILPPSDGQYVLAGLFGSWGGHLYEDSYAWVLKLNHQGLLMWEYQGGHEGGGVQTIDMGHDGGYVVMTTIFSGGYATGGQMIQLTLQGQELWERTYDENDQMMSLIRDSQRTLDGGYLVVGRLFVEGRISKLDSQGVPIWIRSLDNYLFPTVIEELSDGYLVAGDVWPSDADFGLHDVWVLKLDLSYQPVWEHSFGQRNDDEGVSGVCATPDGGALLVGRIQQENTDHYDMLLIKLDVQGRQEWQRTYGGDGDDEASAVQPTPDGGYIVVGYTESKGHGGKDAWVLKLNAEGLLTE